ncbi:methyl-coenzyme M reductase glutamine C-methyltransferase [Methanothermobacter tenebrarum]|uniref:TIGR04014 family B12-binding domain/radical SAM domain-containing protein n=1 Tax=Methanothermobacter tenebrarum TaxID=680118 RepID=A0A328PA13_9EURY|nr:methyl-coenzyme M reductase glutamine C-methyltransferase [Methanothermobacter tenebrarum]MBC7101580.1 TIGR04014 family B12-binding domain/radical SAM domain-containing protein [Methanobacteriales archaeon]MBC7118304.1 TIGR04014 family B12-binding domain/radical SAM domain-containing protein [Methanobacteriaceae archaeon]NPV65180.1 TIGR04014 family B12-binding domain/radical SAM domain-containing protein [Methanobacteriaceae archaeon]RAO79548.1 TIGR04014 family B12-binding domain/radical SAM
MKIVVITPEFYNYGSMIVAGILKDLGHDVTLQKDFKDPRADIVFISLHSTIHLIKYRREINQIKAFKVLGGPVSTNPQLIFRYLDIDLVVRGEAEDKIDKIIEYLEGKREKTSIPGVAFKEDDEIIATPSTQEDSIEHPLPLIPSDISKENIRGANVYIETHRGCVGNCTFCQVPCFFGRKVRSRSLKSIIEEVKEFMRKGARRIAISGGTGTLYGSRKFKNINEDAFIELLKKVSELTRPINLTIPDIRVDLVTDDILETIARYTNGWIYYGIESGSPKILKKMKKGISVDDVSEAVEMARKHGVKVAGSFIVGYPGEEEEDFQATLELADELMLDDYFVSIAEPIPGTALAEEVKKLPFHENPVYMDSIDGRFKSLAAERAFKFLLDSYVFRSIPVPVTDKLFKSIIDEVKSQEEHIRTVTAMIKGLI